MMKNLADEYKNQIDEEFKAIMPDLWSKIEAGVDAIEAEKKNDKITAVADENIDNIVKPDFSGTKTDSNVTVMNQEAVAGNTVRKNTKKRNNNIRIFSGVAIAAVAALLIIPAMKMVFTPRSETFNATEAPAPAGDNTMMADDAEASNALTGAPAGSSDSYSPQAGDVKGDTSKTEDIMSEGTYRDDGEYFDYGDCEVGSTKTDGRFSGTVRTISLKNDSEYYAYVYDTNGERYYVRFTEDMLGKMTALYETKSMAEFVVEVVDVKGSMTIYDLVELESGEE